MHRLIRRLEEHSWNNVQRFSTGNAIKAKPYDEIPSPRGLPLIQNLLPILNIDNMKNYVSFHKKLIQDHGEIYKLRVPKILGGDYVYISNPRDMRELLNNDGPTPIVVQFEPAERIRDGPLKDIFETKGLMSSGKEWWDFRQKVQQDMMRPKSALFYIDDLSDVMDDVIEKLVKTLDHNNEVSGLNNIMHEAALEATGRMFIGTKLGVLHGTEDGVKMIKNAKRMLELMISSIMIPPSILPYTSSYKECADCARVVFNMCRNNIKKAITQDQLDGSLNGTIIRRMIDRCGKDLNVPVIMAADALAAGIDTTGNSANFLLLHLTSSLEKQEILYNEIIDIIGKDGKMTEDKLSEMRYLKACVTESARMVPVAPMLTRRTQIDMVLGGYDVPKGTVVIKHGVMVSNDERFYPNPDMFIPERWLRGSPQQSNADPFTNLPFGHGPRKCIGERFAKLELQMIAFKIIQKYRLEYTGPPVGVEYIGLGCPDKEIRIKMFKR